VQVRHVYVEPRQRAHRLLDGVRDVAEFEVEEDAVSAALDLADDLRPLGVEQLHADLDERLSPGEAVEEPEGLPAPGEVAGDDDVSHV